MNDNEPGQKASTGLRFRAAVTMVLRDVREPGDEVDIGLPLALEPASRGMTSSTIEKTFDSLGVQTLAAVNRLVEARTGGATGKTEEQSAANAPIDPTLGSTDLRLQIDAKILKSSPILVHEAFDQVFRGALAPERVQALPSIIQCAFRGISSATIIGYAEMIPEEDLSQVEPATPINVLPATPTKDHARELAVPSLIAETVLSLGSTVGSAPFPLIPLCLLIAAAAVGNAVRLRSRLFPGL